MRRHPHVTFATKKPGIRQQHRIVFFQLNNVAMMTNKWNKYSYPLYRRPHSDPKSSKLNAMTLPVGKESAASRGTNQYTNNTTHCQCVVCQTRCPLYQMHQTYRIMTLNINGITSPTRLLMLRGFIHKHDADIVLL